MSFPLWRDIQARTATLAPDVDEERGVMRMRVGILALSNVFVIALFMAGAIPWGLH